jgi:tight adherence protein B
MDSVWIVSIFVFCAAALGVQAGYWLLIEGRKTQNVVNRRLQLAQQVANPKDVLETLRRERGFIETDSPGLQRWNDFLTQSGLRLDGKLLVIIAFALSVAFFLFFGLLTGYGFIALGLGLIFAGLGMTLFIIIARQKRIARFSEQLSDALDVIVRGVRAGYPFIVSLGLVAREMPDPIGTEFGMISDEINFGLNVHTALDNLYRRVGHDDLLFFIMAVKVQNQTGGNLAELLSRLSRLIRSRAMLRLKVRAISSEGRLSGIALTAMPFILFGLVTLLSPGYYRDVWDHPLMMPSLILGITLLLIGNFVIYRMVNFKV